MSNDNEGFRLYPRGFLGGTIDPQLERTNSPYGDPDKTRHQYAINQHKNDAGSLLSSPHVDALYVDLIKNSVKFESPEFRTEALRVALSAFGTNNFLIWFTTQYSSPAASGIHNDFLLDTLKFISTGSRNMSVETWASILTITDEGNNIGRIPEKAKEFFGLNQYDVFSSAKVNVMLVDVIQKWCSHPGGLLDMVNTLHILFGDI